MHQHFLANPINPVDGMIEIPSGPGVGMDLNEAKIEREEEPSW